MNQSRAKGAYYGADKEERRDEAAGECEDGVGYHGEDGYAEDEGDEAGAGLSGGCVVDGLELDGEGVG